MPTNLVRESMTREPVVEEGRLVGIFTERDALRGYLRLLSQLGEGNAC